MVEASLRATPARKGPGLLAKIVGAETRLQTMDALQGYLFALPWLLGLAIFVLGPILACIYLSFTDYEILTPADFVGVSNYRRALFEDRLFWPSLGRTLYYSIAVVPITTAGALLLAVLVNQSLFGINSFRTLFFLPHLTPAVAMAVLWSWLLHPDVGPINYVLGMLGLPQPLWMAGRNSVIPAFVLISAWAGIGGNNMLIFLAGLQGVPQELYEAADIDGAGAVGKFWRVTIPMISPAILFNMILNIIGALKVFGLAYVATKGGPAYGSWFLALHIYNHAFAYFRMGYGSALAWIFAFILLVFTLLQMKLSGRWVFYQGGA